MWNSETVTGRGKPPSSSLLTTLPPALSPYQARHSADTRAPSRSAGPRPPRAAPAPAPAPGPAPPGAASGAAIAPQPRPNVSAAASASLPGAGTPRGHGGPGASLPSPPPRPGSARSGPGPAVSPHPPVPVPHGLRSGAMEPEGSPGRRLGEQSRPRGSAAPALGQRRAATGQGRSEGHGLGGTEAIAPDL